MQSVQTSIVVNAPVGSAYELWTNFENFPKFMKALREVRRIDDRHYYLRSERGGKEYETIAEISVKIPERRVAWRSKAGAESSGVVSFESEPDGSTKIRFEMIYDPNAGWQDPLALSERLQSNLVNFKTLMETGDC